MKRLICAAAMVVAAVEGVWAQDATKMRVQLGWIGNVQYGEQYIALEDGLFENMALTSRSAPADRTRRMP